MLWEHEVASSSLAAPTMFIVYILKSDKTKGFYIGYTRNLDLRIIYHNKGLNKSTKHGIPWRVVYTESCKQLHQATQREKFLKRQKNRNFYERLISSSDTPSVRGLGA